MLRDIAVEWFALCLKKIDALVTILRAEPLRRAHTHKPQKTSGHVTRTPALSRGFGEMSYHAPQKTASKLTSINFTTFPFVLENSLFNFTHVVYCVHITARCGILHSVGDWKFSHRLCVPVHFILFKLLFWFDLNFIRFEISRQKRFILKSLRLSNIAFILWLAFISVRRRLQSAFVDALWPRKYFSI